VAVGASETIRAGLALIVTAPLAAVTVTGNADPAAAPAGEAAGGVDGELDGVLADGALLDAQPARAAVAATAVTAASAILGINGFLPISGKEGETAGGRRTPARTDRPSHEGRFRQARQEATWLGPGRAVTVAGQRRNGPCD
jgi:hypothetical protein